jgi:hypothetical protein
LGEKGPIKARKRFLSEISARTTGPGWANGGERETFWKMNRNGKMHPIRAPRNELLFFFCTPFTQIALFTFCFPHQIAKAQKSETSGFSPPRTPRAQRREGKELTTDYTGEHG